MIISTTKTKNNPEMDCHLYNLHTLACVNIKHKIEVSAGWGELFFDDETDKCKFSIYVTFFQVIHTDRRS
jgi:hypothetical protein